MRSIWAGALGAILLTGSAFADLVAVSAWSSDDDLTLGFANATIVPASDNTPPTALDTVDDNVIMVHNFGNPVGRINLRVDFSSATAGENLFKLFLTSGPYAALGFPGGSTATGTLTLVEARYFRGADVVPPGGPTAYYSSGAINQVLTLGENTVGGGFIATGAPSFSGAAITSVYFLFESSAGAISYIDRVGNPEPGTMALMGLGLLGLGGVVVRRRAAKKSKS